MNWSMVGSICVDANARWKYFEEAQRDIGAALGAKPGHLSHLFWDLVLYSHHVSQ